MKKSFQAFSSLIGTRMFGASDEQSRLELPAIQQEMLATLQDCPCDRSGQLEQRIQSARTPADLWMLRSDVHQCISQTYTQTEASARINSLAPLFKGWVPDSQRAPV